MAPNKTSARATSPEERGVTRTAASLEIDPEVRVDLGGLWDEHGVYWYNDEDSGWTWVWSESKQLWEVVGTPRDAIQLSGRAPTSPADRAQQAANDTYRRYVKAAGRQYGRDYGVAGAPMILVGKLAGDAIQRIEPVIPPEVTGSLLPGVFIVTKNNQRLKAVEAEIAAEKDRLDMAARARIAHENGELFQMPIVIASTDKVDESAPPHPLVVAATRKAARPARAPVRVEGLIGDITKAYRREIARLVSANDKLPRNRRITASAIGIQAEQRTLAQVDGFARARGLNPEHIYHPNFRVGVSGPRGGQVSVEIGSPHYGVMIELKKSPRAKGFQQAQGHLVAVDNSLGFPRGGVYVCILGESYTGTGVERRAMGADLDKQKPATPKSAPTGRGR